MYLVFGSVRRVLVLAWAVFLIAPALYMANAAAKAAPATELRVLVHNSFALDKKLLRAFEEQHQAKLSILKGGDAGAMLNRMILTRHAPLADVVYGLDNLTIRKALASGVIQSDGLDGLALPAINPQLALGQGLAPIDYGVVMLNYDIAGLAKRQLALPESLQDFTKPEYRNALVVQNPATSSPGRAFLAATVAHFGEDKVWDFWRKLRANGVKVTEGWTQAYQKEFSLNGGNYPFVVSYNTSPSAEVFYSGGKYAQAPTAALWLPGASWVQVEGAALVQGGKEPELARAFIAFLLSKAVQTDMQTHMWVLPVRMNLGLQKALKDVTLPSPLRVQRDIDEQTQRNWVQQWTRIMR